MNVCVLSAVVVPMLSVKGSLLTAVLWTLPIAPVVFNINISSASGTVIVDAEAVLIKFVAVPGGDGGAS